MSEPTESVPWADGDRAWVDDDRNWSDGDQRWGDGDLESGADPVEPVEGDAVTNVEG